MVRPTFTRPLVVIPVTILAAVALVATLIIIERDPQTVTSHFQTLQEARSADIVGMLPPLLPDSTRNIAITRNREYNTAEGSFTFDAADYTKFAARLTPASWTVAQEFPHAPQSKGFSYFNYDSAGGTWTLALNPQGTGFFNVWFHPLV